MFFFYYIFIFHFVIKINIATQSRYHMKTYDDGALLRIDPVRDRKDETTWECVAENGVGDAVTAEAQLSVHECELYILSIYRHFTYSICLSS